MESLDTNLDDSMLNGKFMEIEYEKLRSNCMLIATLARRG